MENLIVMLINSIEKSIEESLVEMQWDLDKSRLEELAKQQSTIFKKKYLPILFQEKLKLKSIIFFYEQISRIDIPIHLINSFVSSTVIDEAINTQCENIQTSILKDFTLKWKDVLALFESDINNPDLGSYKDNYGVILDKIVILKNIIEVYQPEQKVDFTDRIIRINSLKRIKAAKADFIALAEYFFYCKGLVKGALEYYEIEIKSYIN